MYSRVFLLSYLYIYVFFFFFFCFFGFLLHPRVAPQRSFFVLCFFFFFFIKKYRYHRFLFVSLIPASPLFLAPCLSQIYIRIYISLSLSLSLLFFFFYIGNTLRLKYITDVNEKNVLEREKETKRRKRRECFTHRRTVAAGIFARN